MSKTNILELTTASVVSETEDYIPMVDVSDTTESGDGTTKKATVRKLLKDKALPSGDIVGTSDVQTLGGKTLTSPVITDIDITGGSATDIDITGGILTNPTMNDVDITGGSIEDVDITGGSIEDVDITGGSIEATQPLLSMCHLNLPDGTNHQTLVSGTSYINFGAGSELYNPFGLHSTASNSENIYIDRDGLYFVSGYVKMNDSTGGNQRIMSVQKNKAGSIVDGRVGFDPAGRWALTLTGVSSLSAGDYITLQMSQNAGSITLRAAHLCLFLIAKL